MESGLAVMYFHCFVKICPIENEASCSLSTVCYIVQTLYFMIFQVTGTINTCSGSSTAGRRRSKTLNETSLATVDIAGPAIAGLFSTDFNLMPNIKIQKN